MGGPELEELSLEERQVQEEAGVDEDTWCVDVDCTAVILEESLRGCTVDIELDDLEHFCLHGEKLLRRVRVPRHLYQVRQYGRVDLLELAGDEEGRDAQ